MPRARCRRVRRLEDLYPQSAGEGCENARVGFDNSERSADEIVLELFTASTGSGGKISGVWRSGGGDRVHHLEDASG